MHTTLTVTLTVVHWWQILIVPMTMIWDKNPYRLYLFIYLFCPFAIPLGSLWSLNEDGARTVSVLWKLKHLLVSDILHQAPI